MSLFGITNICRGQKFMHFGISIGFYKLYNLPQNFLWVQKKVKQLRIKRINSIAPIYYHDGNDWTKL